MVMIALPVAVFFFITTFIAAGVLASFTRKQAYTLMEIQTEECVLKLEKTLVVPMKMTEAMAWVFKDGFFKSDRATNKVFINMSLAYPELSGFYGCRPNNTMFKGPNVSLPPGYLPKSKSWYTGGVERKGELCYSDVYVDALTNERVLTFSQAVYKNRHLDGVIAFDYPLNDLQKIISELKTDEGDQSFILSAAGNFFMHETYTPDDSMLEVEGGAYREIAERLLAIKDGFVEGKIGGTTYVFRIDRIPMTGWYYVLGKKKHFL